MNQILICTYVSILQGECCQEQNFPDIQEPPLKKRCQERDLADIQEQALEQQHFEELPIVASMTACHAEQDCHPTEDTCACFSQGGRM